MCVLSVMCDGGVYKDHASVSCGTSHWLAASKDGCMTKKQPYAVSSRTSEAGHVCNGLPNNATAYDSFLCMYQ